MKTKNLFLILFGIIIFFIYVLPYIDNNNNQETHKNIKKITETLNNINDLPDDILKLDNNLCSNNCCNHTQWLPPSMINKNKNDNYIGNNFSCNSGGCLCITKKNFNYLSNHGSII